MLTDRPAYAGGGLSVYTKFCTPSLLKRERVRRQIYITRQDARADVFNYIEMFYNPKRRHNTAGDISPVEFEKRYFQRLGSV